MTVKILTSPQFRDDIRISFEDLADRDLQMKEWIDPNYPHPYWDSLKMYVFDTIYNTHDLNTKSSEHVGKIFYDEEEAQKIHKFSAWFDELTDDIGWEEGDSEYLKHPEWPKVWEEAKKIVEIMKANDEKYDIHASWEAWHNQVTKHTQV